MYRKSKSSKMSCKNTNESTSHQTETLLRHRKLLHYEMCSRGNERHRDTPREDSSPLRISAPAVFPLAHRHGNLVYTV